ncbi:MAG: DUF4249 domain-containing protein [Bacteroidales bacterium]|nr:DUF4249 domain-containing protein [Bacteroidales bacterium]
MTRKTGIILIIMLINISCERSIEVELPPVDEKIAIKGLFSTDKILSLKVSHSKYIFDTTSTFHLDNVVVDLYENESFIETLKNIGSFYYGLKFVSTSGFKCSERNTYTINVSATGFETVFAETIVPESVNIVMVDTSTVIAELPDWYFGHLGPYNHPVPLLECRIRFKDFSDVHNYYTLQVEKPYLDSRVDSSGNRNWFYNGTKQLPYVSYDQIVEYLINNEDAIIMFEEIYNYEQVCFSDKLIDGEEYELVILLDKNLLKGKTYFKLYSISKEYYLFGKSLNMRPKPHYDPFAEPVQVYSNIQNGVGIFAGASFSIDSSIVFPLPDIN